MKRRTQLAVGTVATATIIAGLAISRLGKAEIVLVNLSDEAIVSVQIASPWDAQLIETGIAIGDSLMIETVPGEGEVNLTLTLSGGQSVAFGGVYLTGGIVVRVEYSGSGFAPRFRLGSGP